MTDPANRVPILLRLVAQGVDRASVAIRPRGRTMMDPGAESRRMERSIGR